MSEPEYWEDAIMRAQLAGVAQRYVLENERLTADLAAARAEADALAEVVQHAIDAGEAWEAVDDTESAGEWSMYTMPDLMREARAILARRPERRGGGGAG